MKTSGENYLETIYRLMQQSESVRSIDVAHETGYSKPSVSRALVRLKKEDVIVIDEKGLISLTDKGIRIAENLGNRQKVIRDFLVRYAEMSEESADREAGQLKHAISDEATEAMKKALSKQKKRFSGGLHQR